MMKIFNIERRLLLTFYLILYIFIILFGLFKFFLYEKVDDKPYTFKNIIYQFSILVIFAISNLIEGTTNLLSYKIIPPFVKICHINNKYLISYSTVFGKIIGGLIFSVLCLMDYIHEKNYGKNWKENPFQKTHVFKYGTYIFCVFIVFSFIIFAFCYRSLRVRAIAKLFYISE